MAYLVRDSGAPLRSKRIFELVMDKPVGKTLLLKGILMLQVSETVYLHVCCTASAPVLIEPF